MSSGEDFQGFVGEEMKQASILHNMPIKNEVADAQWELGTWKQRAGMNKI